MDRRAFLLAGGATLATAAPAAAQDAADRTIVPGVRFGAINRRTTWADLRRLYGASARIGKFSTGDGEFGGAELFAGKPDHLRVYGSEDGRRIESLETVATAGLWRTAEGIRVGAPLDLVVKVNGRPVTLMPFGGEGGGHFIGDHKGGRLKNDLGLYFFFDATLTEAERKVIDADNGVASDHPVVVKARMYVYRVAMGFPEG